MQLAVAVGQMAQFRTTRPKFSVEFLFRHLPDFLSMAPQSRQTIPLGEQLHWWRTHLKCSRRQLAERASISMSTIQHLEKNNGTLTYYQTALRALGLKLHARGRGNRKLGTALTYERREQTIARRELARHLEVSRNTLAALESNKSVRIATLERYANAIGVGLVVQPLPPDQQPRSLRPKRGR